MPTFLRAVFATMAMLLAAAAPALAQTANDAPPQAVTVVVPVVGSVFGAGLVHWKTDVELHNDQGTDVDVVLMLPAAPDQPFLSTTIPAGGTTRFRDVVGEAFGIEAALSPLLVITTGRRSVSIQATAYAMRGAELVTAEPIVPTYAAAAFPFRMLNNLSFSEDFRTNIGIANLGATEASFTLALQRLPGRNVAVTHINVPPNSLWHVPVQAFFPLITNGGDFSVLVETGSPETYVYASVIDNETTAARFVAPAIGIPTQPQ